MLFDTRIDKIQLDHLKQTIEDVEQLNATYAKVNPFKRIFNKPIGIWDAIMHLGFVHDPTDKDLLAVSQLTHTIQVVNSMDEAGIKDEDMLVTAWLHDIGKLLLLTDEDPANIVCLNYVIKGNNEAGLNNCVCSWNHDEFAYIKFGNILSERGAWLLRYHSLNLNIVEPYLSENDKIKIEKWLKPFMLHDRCSKSISYFPRIDISWHQNLLEKHLPGLFEL